MGKHLKVAISFSGDGFGHTSRMIALATQLQTKYSLSFWCPERTHSLLKEYFPQAPVFALPLLSLLKKDNQIRLWATFLANRKTLFFNQSLQFGP